MLFRSGIFLQTTTASSTAAGQSINVSYSYEPQGYMRESSSRTVALLITILGALAIVLFVLMSMWKSDSLQNILGYR